MTQSIRQDQASSPDEVRNDPDIRQITGSEQKGGLRPLKSRERGFEVRMGRKSSADQSRSSGPSPILFRRMYCGAGDFRMGGKSQVIVGGQQDGAASGKLDGRSRAGFQWRQSAHERSVSELFESALKHADSRLPSEPRQGCDHTTSAFRLH